MQTVRDGDRTSTRFTSSATADPKKNEYHCFWKHKCVPVRPISTGWASLRLWRSWELMAFDKFNRKKRKKHPAVWHTDLLMPTCCRWKIGTNQITATQRAEGREISGYLRGEKGEDSEGRRRGEDWGLWKPEPGSKNNPLSILGFMRRGAEASLRY